MLRFRCKIQAMGEELFEATCLYIGVLWSELRPDGATEGDGQRKDHQTHELALRPRFHLLDLRQCAKVMSTAGMWRVSPGPDVGLVSKASDPRPVL